MKVLVIIPAYNEELNIKKVVSNLIDHYPQYNYVVVNDGSADSTSQICHQEGYNIIDLPVNLGLAGAFQTGLKYADQEGYDCAIQFDADGQHRPEYIEDLLKEIENGYQLNCKISGGDVDLLSFSLYVPDRLQADMVKENFQSNPDIIYECVLAVLTKDKNLAKDILNKLQ